MLSDIENLDIMLGENHFSRMREMRALIVIRLGDQEASQEMNLKTMVNITTWKQVVPTPVLVPIMAKIQQETIQVPRSTGCQVS